MYNIADKLITGCKFDFAIFAILTLQIPIACFDMMNQHLGQSVGKNGTQRRTKVSP